MCIFQIWSLFIGMCSEYISTKLSVHTCYELHSGVLILLSSKTIWCPSSGLCFLRFRKECPSLESHWEDSLRRRSAEHVIFPRGAVSELLIGSRDILHPPTLPPTYAPLATVHTWAHLSIGMPGEKAMGSQPWCRVYREKSTAWWETMLNPHRRQSFYFLFRISRGFSPYSIIQIMQCNILQELSRL